MLNLYNIIMVVLRQNLLNSDVPTYMTKDLINFLKRLVSSLH